MIHLLSCLAIFQFYGMNYIPMRIYRVLIRYRLEKICLGQESLLQIEDDHPRSAMSGLNYLAPLVVLRVDQSLAIWCATRV